MDWQGEGIVCARAKHGENGVVLKLLTAEHGLYAGFVPGGAGRRHRGQLELGNTLTAIWRARTAEQLGNFSVESCQSRAAKVMADAERLAALTSLCALTAATLPERLALPALYHGLEHVLNGVADEAQAVEGWASKVVKFEALLLAELGYGLDLSSCAATGSREQLIYVSPKSARAVSRAAGAPYKGKLLPLPAFLLDDHLAPAALSEALDGFQLTGFFLEKFIFAPRGLAMPEARPRLVERLRRHSA